MSLAGESQPKNRMRREASSNQTNATNATTNATDTPASSSKVGHLSYSLRFLKILMGHIVGDFTLSAYEHQIT